MKVLVLNIPHITPTIHGITLPMISEVRVSEYTFYEYDFVGNDILADVYLGLNREDFIPVDKLCKLAKLVYNVKES